MKQKLKREIDKSTVTVGNFKTPLLATNRTTKQKKSKDIKEFIDTTDQKDLMNIYRTFYPSITEYTFFLSAHITFTKTGHILSQEKTSINFKELK